MLTDIQLRTRAMACSLCALPSQNRPRNVPAADTEERNVRADCYDQDLTTSSCPQDNSELLKPLLVSTIMSVAVVNSSTITGFVDDTASFDEFVGECLVMLDEDGNGVLSREEVRGGFWKILPFGFRLASQEDTDNIGGLVFERFDEDRNGSLDRKEFKSLMTEILNAIARGIGGSPVIVLLEQGSFLMKAVQLELVTKPSPTSS